MRIEIWKEAWGPRSIDEARAEVADRFPEDDIV